LKTHDFADVPEAKVKPKLIEQMHKGSEDGKKESKA